MQLTFSLLKPVRVDKALSDAVPQVSRQRVRELIESGNVTLNGAIITSPSQKVSGTLDFTLQNLERPPQTLLPQDIPLDILFEDEHLLVINKPAGLVAHPGAGTPDGTLVNALLYHCNGQLSEGSAPTRPGIVHRLDKLTSGVILAAKTDEAHAALSKAIQDRDITRIYHALVWGTPSPSDGIVETNHGRDPRNRLRMSTKVPLSRGGRKAISHYRRLGPVGLHASLVEFKLETGRTHQIRLHCEHLGHPIVADPVYDRGRERFLRYLSAAQRQAVKDTHRQALHAHRIAFVHPITNESLMFTVDMPPELASLIETLSL